MASPHIGNYGVNKFDEESESQVAGFILKRKQSIHLIGDQRVPLVIT